MKSVKKVLAILLVAILMATAFAGCGKKDEPEDLPEATTGATAEETATPEPEETPATTPEGTAEPAIETSEPVPENTEEPVVEPSESEPETGRQVSTDEVLGTVEGNTYTNQYFGFTLTIPEGWYIASREELALLLAAAADILSGDTEGETIDLESQQIIPLLFTATADPFNQSGTNANMVCLAQNIAEYSRLIKDARSLMNIQIQGIKAQGMDMTFDDVEVIDIDGQEVARVQIFAGMEIRQTMYAFMKDGFAVVFTLLSFTDEEARLLADMMNSLSFN
jgi:predicted small lipoprotein YifL